MTAILPNSINIFTMKLKDYCGKYSIELDCKLKFKQIREQAGIDCKTPGCKVHFWINDKQLWECKDYKY